jgi:hypothetical protein
VLVDVFFILDVALNFRTAYIVDAATMELEDDPRRIARRYLGGWFAVDLASAIPFGWFGDFGSDGEVKFTGLTQTLG